MYNHAPPDYDCPLCAIAQRTAPESSMFAPSDVVLQDADVLAMVSAFQWPRNPGNVVVVPMQHYENLYDLPLSHAGRILELVKATALAMKAAWKCDGVSTRQHNEPAGNQDVWHYHQHVTPRYVGDDFYATYVAGKGLMPVAERARYAADLRSRLTP
jgi:histidine triad (HIT) family protein